MDQAVVPYEKPGTFKKGRKKTGGRKAADPNKMPTTLKECILRAGEILGSDGKGKDGLTGWIIQLAVNEPRTYAMLLGRVLPYQVETRSDVKSEIVYRSVTEIRREMASRGVDMRLVAKLIEHDPEPEMADADDAVTGED
jgi:hypothetical protein